MLSSILVIRKMKIKTTIRYNFTPTRMSLILKKQKKLGDVKKLETWYIVCRDVKCCSQCGKQFGGSLNIKIELLSLI